MQRSHRSSKHSRNRGSVAPGPKKFTPPPDETTYIQDQRYILYVKKTQPASREAMKLATPLLDYQVFVVDVKEDLEPEDIPPWLNGTPCLVHTNTQMAYKGSMVLEELQRIVEEDDGTGLVTSMKPADWLKNCARFEPELGDDPDELRKFMEDDNRKITEKELRRFNRMREKQQGQNSYGNAQLGYIEDDEYSNLFNSRSGIQNKKVTDDEIQAYMARREQLPARCKRPPRHANQKLRAKSEKTSAITAEHIKRYQKKRTDYPKRLQRPAIPGRRPRH